jgi:hypothetical protein
VVVTLLPTAQKFFESRCIVALIVGCQSSLKISMRGNGQDKKEGENDGEQNSSKAHVNYPSTTYPEMVSLSLKRNLGYRQTDFGKGGKREVSE